MKMTISNISADRNPGDICWRFSIKLEYDQAGFGHNINHRRNLIKVIDKYWDTKAVSFASCGWYVIRGLIYFKDEITMTDFMLTKDRLIGKKI